MLSLSAGAAPDKTIVAVCHTVDDLGRMRRSTMLTDPKAFARLEACCTAVVDLYERNGSFADVWVDKVNKQAFAVILDRLAEVGRRPCIG